MSETEWSTDWQASTDATKQRKYRANAPHHKRKQFVSARLHDELRDALDTKTMPVREGDRVEVVRGDYSGTRGEVINVDRDEYTLDIEGVERETVSGSEVKVAIRPSNVIVTKLNLQDDSRVAEDISDEERAEISAEAAEEPEEDEGELDEDDEMEEDAADGAEQDEAEADAEPDAADSDETDYTELVQGNIDEIKDAIREQDLDEEQVLEAEKANKERVTLIDWLEDRIDGDQDE